MKLGSRNTFDAIDVLGSYGAKYNIFSIKKVSAKLGISVDYLPYSLKILLENLLRYEDGITVTEEDIQAIGGWLKHRESKSEIAFRPARVLMQDFTGVPAIVDLAAMRDAAKSRGIDAGAINPQIPVDLVIDHSVQVDKYGTKNALSDNVNYEMERNIERYRFLKWGQQAFSNFRVVSPGMGICHQINLEYLADIVCGRTINGKKYAFPDTVIGTDSHTTMINALNVLGWGVGGIEAEAAILGQPISMIIPQVIGVRITGELLEGVMATDVVLHIVEMLREYGVVGKFVEFFGSGLDHLTLADRATISNMAPEYGATCGLFPIDNETLKYLRQTGRTPAQVHLVKNYAKKQGLWRVDSGIIYTDTVSLNLANIQSNLAGPKRPQDRVALKDVKANFTKNLPQLSNNSKHLGKSYKVGNNKYKLQNGDVVIAAITSCTNTSNPFAMIGAGLLAKKAILKGLQSKPWVKTSLAPGSKVVSQYLEQADLQRYFDALGFNIVGYGCTTCIGNSGPLDKDIEQVIDKNQLVAVSILSGNRNFEGRIHPLTRANYLASPLLCVAYALAGTINIDFSTEPIGLNGKKQEIYLKDIWPSSAEIANKMKYHITPDMFSEKYANIFNGTDSWQNISVDPGMNYSWQDDSTYIRKPTYFDDDQQVFTGDIKGARILAIFQDSVTTDHISPAGNIAIDSPAANYLIEHGVERKDFNSYGARRGNHEVMMRGTFANIRIKNCMMKGKEGGYTEYNGEVMAIHDAAIEYKKTETPLVVFAGKEYGTGSSRDWAAKGTKLLGVKAVITESYERIHRSNLVGMGVVPLVIQDGLTKKSLELYGDEEIDLIGLDNLSPGCQVTCFIKRKGHNTKKLQLICRVDTHIEVEYIKHGGILSYMLNKLSHEESEKN